MQIRELTQNDRARWEDYVHNQAGTSIYHLAGWKQVMEKTFGLETLYLFAQEGSEILGILPMLHVKSWLAGHYLTTLPGGMHASNVRSAELLLESAKSFVESAAASYLILRDAYVKWDLPDLVTDESHCTLVVELSTDTEQVWRGIKKRYRQLTSQAMRAGLHVTNGTRAFEDIYPTYSRSMRDRGTPTLGLDFFQNMMSELPGLFRFLTVHHEDRVLGGGFVTPFKDTVYCTWGGMLRESYDLRPNHLLYWESLKYAAESGHQWLDLGRSRYDSGTFVFKKSWGAEPRQLYQQYYLNGIDQPPAVGAGRKADPKYEFFVRLWSKLPMPVTEIMGPQLRRRMPFG